MDIVDGYKGIMDLDLTDVREEFKKDLTIQHQKDIDEYKSQQSRLEPRLRYENTIGRIRIIHSIDEKCQKKEWKNVIRRWHEIKRITKKGVHVGRKHTKKFGSSLVIL